MTMGEKILNLRKARGWSQEELANRVGVTRQAVSRWEADAAKPDADKIIAICDLFGVSADYLLRDRGAGEHTPPQQDQIQETALNNAVRQMTLKQWGGVGLIFAGSLMLFILKIVYVFQNTNYYYNGLEGYAAFLLFEELLLIWCMSFVAVIAGLWILFLKKRWSTSDEWEDIKTMFDIE